MSAAAPELTVVGAGVAGLACAFELAERGARVEVLERAESIGPACCSWFAGGMLAPWCELESAERLIAELGRESIGWWRERFSGTELRGSIVLAHGRDVGELVRFARRTERFEWLDGEALAALEPDLAGRFERALFFPEEGHLSPRAALAELARKLTARGVSIRYGVEASLQECGEANRLVVDCTGLAARGTLTDLRGVKGEMLHLRSREISLSRPVRVLHPRMPLYIVPRGEGLYMVGATVLESDQPSRISARSMLELLTAAYALHPGFGEAEVVETGTGVRPAFPDNLPRIVRDGRTLHVNGLFRHGFLLAPALARRLADHVLNGTIFPEVMADENHRERRLA
ncbi:MAG: glycine oxidase ThiO [Steroidobacteraceae bacterium]